MGAAIWSSSLQEMKRFPLPLFLRFNHHGLLDITHRPQWYVVPGGSREYIRAMLEKLGDRLTLRLNSPVQRVSRHKDGVTLQLENGSHTFDQVIFACHSARRWRCLRPDASRARGAGRYRLAAQRGGFAQRSALAAGTQRAWASWNYRLSEQEQASACVTYNMNILQGCLRAARCSASP
jgi:predicted NAD/FAD-binding protein